MLKIKKQLNYRRGTKAEKCLFCEYFRPEQPLTGINGADMGKQPRCTVIGLKAGRMYAVNKQNRCDRFSDMFAK